MPYPDPSFPEPLARSEFLVYVLLFGLAAVVVLLVLLVAHRRTDTRVERLEQQIERLESRIIDNEVAVSHFRYRLDDLHSFVTQQAANAEEAKGAYPAPTGGPSEPATAQDLRALQRSSVTGTASFLSRSWARPA